MNNSRKWFCKESIHTKYAEQLPFIAFWIALAIIMNSFAECQYKETEFKYKYKTEQLNNNLEVKEESNE